MYRISPDGDRRTTDMASQSEIDEAEATCAALLEEWIKAERDAVTLARHRDAYAGRAATRAGSTRADYDWAVRFLRRLQDEKQ
jgi:hypothetical protein